MKTAEEWATEINGIKWLDNSHPVMTAFVKQIQLDAMRDGMRRAAELSNVANPTGQMVTKSILSAAEQLTEKDLI